MVKTKEKEMSDTAMAYAFENAYSQIANKLRDIAVDALAKETLLAEEDYQTNLAEVRRLWGSPVGTADGQRLDLLLDAVIAYEDEQERWSCHDRTP